LPYDTKIFYAEEVELGQYMLKQEIFTKIAGINVTH
jgi:hypothetical protein